MHEAQFHDHKWFATLTYKTPPPGGTLVKKHVQDFLKRLRKKYGGGIRYFYCGEYGDVSQRPHYHAILFGCDFPDRRKHTTNKRGEVLYTSAILEQLWGHGFTLLGAVSFESAAYVARYIVKKVTGEAAGEHYKSIDRGTGEIIDRLPEFINMSLKPAIGATWFEKFQRDVYPNDFVIRDGYKQPAPKFYDRLYERIDLEAIKRIKYRRIKDAKKRKEDQTPERLAVRETVAKSKLSIKKRDL